jgi:hypothetical protein
VRGSPALQSPGAHRGGGKRQRALQRSLPVARTAVEGRRWVGGEEDKWVVVVLDGKCSGARRNEGGYWDGLRGEWPRSRAPFIELRR